MKGKNGYEVDAFRSDYPLYRLQPAMRRSHGRRRPSSSVPGLQVLYCELSGGRWRYRRPDTASRARFEPVGTGPFAEASRGTN